MIRPFGNGRLVLSLGTALFFLAGSALHAQLPIKQARQLPPGSVVTTTGTITSGNEFGWVRYMQDAEAGIALYSSSLSSTNTGDSIIVTGVVSSYRGQLQLEPVISYTVIASGRDIIPVVSEDISAVTSPLYESRKMIMICSGLSTCESSLESGWYQMFDQWGNVTRLVIAEDHPLEGLPIEHIPYTIEGIWTKFEDQYQLVAQEILDASEGNCRIISPAVVSYNAGTTVLTWENVPLGLSTAEWGDMNFHQEAILGLKSGTVQWYASLVPPGFTYQARLSQQDSTGSYYYSPPVLFSVPDTKPSPIEVLFNRTVDPSFTDGSAPLATGSSAIESDLVERIESATSTLDVAMYNTNRSSIVDALEEAVQRGVSVRFIADGSTSNSALDGLLHFPIYFRSGLSGIMHNKFVIADADDPQKAWVWTGSTNWSTNQLSTDPNHACILHDQALALSYRREFEEMWGHLPDHENGRAGDFKTNNTVHRFLVGGVPVESFFSPSDETNCQVLNVIASTDHHIQIGLLLLTRDDLVDELIALHQGGKDVRVILEDEESSASAFARLTTAGVQVVTHDPSPIFHHKYAIIDEGFPDSDPQVISGSHNWTWSADNINDENTLIIHDQSVTNIFRQEFEARWKELVPTSILQVSDSGISAYPNPASGVIYLHNATLFSCEAELINVHGQVMQRQMFGADETNQVALKENIVPGLYLLRFRWPDQTFSSQSILIQ